MQSRFSKQQQLEIVSKHADIYKGTYYLTLLVSFASGKSGFEEQKFNMKYFTTKNTIHMSSLFRVAPMPNKKNPIFYLTFIEFILEGKRLGGREH